MKFYLLLALVNLVCFLPLYLLNFRTAPNPFRFLNATVKSNWKWPLKMLYARFWSPDPFRIHFDFTFFVLLVVATHTTGPITSFAATLLLAFGFVELQYTVVMNSIFKRPPALTSDLSLLKSGVALAQRQVYWMIPAVFCVLVLVWYAAGIATAALFAAAPEFSLPPLVIAALLLPPCLYAWSQEYVEYLWRTVYSPILHLVVNIRFCARLGTLYRRDAKHFERYNMYKNVKLKDGPNIVLVCVESYGGIVYRDAACGAGVSALLRSHEAELGARGYRFASTFSEAPLFAGGSWLSYASFTYGVPIDHVQLYDGLFSRPGSFDVYESVFHVLRRNGYDNVLLCPLGGVDTRSVDWDSLDRCFQSRHRIVFDDLAYSGPRVNYFGLVRRFSPLDQFALNFGYERASQLASRFSLFFCTLNSHYPWHSFAEASDDWRSVNAPADPALAKDSQRSIVDRYNASIRYQLDYILRFARDRAEEEPLIILFGDHQPPVITPEHMGKQTPVHVLSRNPALIDVFLAHGFEGALDLTDARPRPIRHEGFLSLLMKGMQAAYGTAPDLDLPYRERGAPVFGELSADGRLRS